MKKQIMIGLFVMILLTLVISGCQSNNVNKNNGKSQLDELKVIVYKSPTCGCCVNYVADLERKGYDVTVKEMQDLSDIKKQYGIPTMMQSCHTTIFGDYFVEGHVPIEAVEKMLNEQPAIDGIVLPGMPSGSPGMPGPKRGDFVIHSIIDGEDSGEFMRI